MEGDGVKFGMVNTKTGVFRVGEVEELKDSIYVALLEETEFVPVSPDDFFKSGKL